MMRALISKSANEIDVNEKGKNTIPIIHFYDFSTLFNKLHENALSTHSI